MSEVTHEPAGFSYADDFLDRATEGDLLAYLSSLTFESYVMRGNVSKRAVRHFGLRYDYSRHALRAADPIPTDLQPLVGRAEDFAGLAKGSVVEALVNRYPAGAGVGWHNDAPVYKTIIGISLGAPCTIQFKMREMKTQRPVERCLLPRSVYSMRGQARDDWQHRVPPTRGERFSLTFRSLANGGQ